MSLLDDYEQQYAALIADITALIGRINVFTGAEKRELCSKIDTHLSEAQELVTQEKSYLKVLSHASGSSLELIGLEIREFDPQQRQSLTSKLNCYQSELKRLSSEFQNAKERSINTYDSNDDFEEIGIKDEQKQRLLNNSERIERTGNKLAEGYRIVLETEQIGNHVLQDLHHQRETIQNSRSKLRETNAELGRSSRVLNSMLLRALRQKIVLYSVAVFFVIIVVISIYFSVSR